jgi:hypothetical protein
MQRMGLVDDAMLDLYVAVFLLGFMSEQGMAFNGNQGASSVALREHLAKVLTQTLAAASRTR